MCKEKKKGGGGEELVTLSWLDLILMKGQIFLALKGSKSKN